MGKKGKRIMDTSMKCCLLDVYYYMAEAL
uniref:Uncharacterized protein n=1 Tax=Rhizophora mucronata TaxID=61149 RepID=A0A2P2PXS0_RHIMU